MQLDYPKDDPTTVASILLHGDYEPETCALIEAVLKPGMTFVDLGANIGIFTLLGARAVGPRGRVVAFEPAPKVMVYLERNVHNNGFAEQVTLVPSAVADRTGLVRFAFSNEYSVAAHIAVSEEPAALEVHATSLDEYFRDAGWPAIHLIKMDVEGAEPSVLRGMPELVRRNPRVSLVFEVLASTFEGHPDQLAAFFESLAALGFNAFAVLHRDGAHLSLPRDLDGLMTLARRVNLNIHATRVEAAGIDASCAAVR
jgi:FkbM family methyltransferase